MRSYSCPTLGCRNQKGFSHLVCSDCWKLVPSNARRAVFRLYREAYGSPAYHAACEAAREAIDRARGTARDPTPPAAGGELDEQKKSCPGCHVARIREDLLACLSCWMLLPHSVRRSIDLARTYQGVESSEYSRAVKAAIVIWNGVRTCA